MRIEARATALIVKIRKAGEETSAGTAKCEPLSSSAVEIETNSAAAPYCPCHAFSPTFSINLAGDGRLKYGFTSVCEDREISIGP
jgi:hypothetical protein